MLKLIPQADTHDISGIQIAWCKRTNIYIYDTDAKGYSEVADIPEGYMQTVHEGRFGEYISYSTVQEISDLKEGLYQEDIDKASSLEILRLVKALREKDEENALMAAQILELMGVLS